MQIFGYDHAEFVNAKSLLAEAQERYHVFHIHVGRGGRQGNPRVMNYWSSLLGKHFIVLEDYKKLGLLIAMIVALFTEEADRTIRQVSDETVRRALASAI